MLFLTFIKWFKKKNKRSLEGLNPIMSTGNNGTAERELFSVQLTKVLNSLTEEKQKIVRLKFWANMDFNEIAKYLNKRESVIRKSYYNSMLAIKSRLR